MPLSEKLTQVSTDCPPTILEDSPPIPQSSLPPIYEPRGVPFARVVDSTQSTTRDEVTDSVNTTSNSIEDAIMADTTTYIPTPSNNDNFGMGGGLLGGVVLTSLLGANRLGGVGGAGLGYEAGAINRNADVLQAMNQQQLASSTQIMTQDINHVGKDVALAAGATQSAIAAGNLQNTISTLQGQTALTSSIMDSTLTNAAGHTNILGQVASASADTNANINNARQGISGDIREALSVLDNDLHSISASIDRSIEGVRNDVTRSHLDMINAAHRGEISALKSANDIERSVYNTASVTQRAITDDGDKTRSLISNINVADLNRQIVVAENKLADARHDHRQSVASHDIIINNNNNATAVANALAQQQQQQQSNNLYAAVLGLTGHVNTLTQFTLNNGSGSATAIGGVAGWIRPSDSTYNSNRGNESVDIDYDVNLNVKLNVKVCDTLVDHHKDDEEDDTSPPETDDTPDEHLNNGGGNSGNISNHGNSNEGGIDGNLNSGNPHDGNQPNEVPPDTRSTEKTKVPYGLKG